MNAIKVVERTHPTAGLQHGTDIDIERVDTATDQDAIHAFATDLLRRAKAGELTGVRIDASDVNGNTLRYRLLSLPHSQRRE